MSHLAPGSRPPPWPATSTSVCRLAAFVPRSSPVLADRGLYAGWPFRRIVRLGWHPFLRLNAGGTLRPAGSRRFYPLPTFVPHVGARWHGTGTAFESAPRQLPSMRLACWEMGTRRSG